MDHSDEDDGRRGTAPRNDAHQVDALHAVCAELDDAGSGDGGGLRKNGLTLFGLMKALEGNFDELNPPISDSDWFIDVEFGRDSDLTR